MPQAYYTHFQYVGKVYRLTKVAINTNDQIYIEFTIYLHLKNCTVDCRYAKNKDTLLIFFFHLIYQVQVLSNSFFLLLFSRISANSNLLLDLIYTRKHTRSYKYSITLFSKLWYDRNSAQAYSTDHYNNPYLTIPHTGFEYKRIIQN